MEFIKKHLIIIHLAFFLIVINLFVLYFGKIFLILHNIFETNYFPNTISNFNVTIKYMPLFFILSIVFFTPVFKSEKNDKI